MTTDKRRLKMQLTVTSLMTIKDYKDSAMFAVLSLSDVTTSSSLSLAQINKVIT